MKRIVWLLSILALMVVACGAPPPLELGDEPFRDQANGYSLRYPQGWQHVYVEHVGGEVFYQGGEPIEDIVALRAVPEVPIIVVIAGSVDDIAGPSLAGIEDSKAMLEVFLAWLGDVEGGKVGRVRTGTVAGQPAAAADIRWPFLLDPGTTVTGRAVAVLMGEQAFFIEAAGRAESWTAFEPTFEAILDSVAFE
jgi:hypothetical protein